MDSIQFHQNKDYLIRTIEDMREKPLKPHCHLYKRHMGKTIGQAAKTEAMDYSHEARERPGLMLLSVILSIHTDYTKNVEPILNRLRQSDTLQSFLDLEDMVFDDVKFQNNVGNQTKKKDILRKLLSLIQLLKNQRGIAGDYEIMHDWALDANFSKYKSDPIGKLSGIGPATFQHLRMNFGCDTVKPDQRVKQVLKNAFRFEAADDYEAVEAVETLAKLTGYTAIELDQIFVNYGSGYYCKSVSSSENQMSADTRTTERSRRNHMNRAENDAIFSLVLPEIVVALSDLMEQSGIVRGKDFNWRKRGDNAYIAELARCDGPRKNIITVWPNKFGGGSIRIVGDKKYDEKQRIDHTKIYDDNGDSIARAMVAAYDKINSPI